MADDYTGDLTHNMSGLNLALQWHLWAPHVHGNSHASTVFFGGSPLCVPTFMSVYCLDIYLI